MIDLVAWRERARRDDVLDTMVPSDLRVILADMERLKSAAEMAKSVFEKLERGGMQPVSFSQVTAALRRALTA